MRKKLCITAMVMTVVLTGCTSVPDLSKVDNDLAAQYMADSLLKNDESYSGISDYDHSVLEDTPTPKPTVAATPTPSVDNGEPGQTGKDNNGSGDGASVNSNGTDGTASSAAPALQQVSASEVFGVSGVEIEAVKYQLVKSYGSQYANCTAADGKKLVVVQFKVSNTTGSAKKVNLVKSGVQASLNVNGQTVGSALLTIVEGDLQYMNTRLAAGKKKQGVLIFEVDKSAKIDSVEVHLSAEQKEAVVAVE